MKRLAVDPRTGCSASSCRSCGFDRKTWPIRCRVAVDERDRPGRRQVGFWHSTFSSPAVGTRSRSAWRRLEMRECGRRPGSASNSSPVRSLRLRARFWRMRFERALSCRRGRSTGVVRSVSVAAVVGKWPAPIRDVDEAGRSWSSWVGAIGRYIGLECDPQNTTRAVRIGR